MKREQVTVATQLYVYAQRKGKQKRIANLVREEL